MAKCSTCGDGNFRLLVRRLRLIQEGKIKLGTCEFCGEQQTLLVASLTADPDQKVCAMCHADSRIPTEAIDG